MYSPTSGKPWPETSAREIEIEIPVPRRILRQRAPAVVETGQQPRGGRHVRGARAQERREVPHRDDDAGAVGQARPDAVVVAHRAVAVRVAFEGAKA